MVQLHKKFTDDQVIELIEKYLRKEVGRKYIQEILGINKTRFFALVRAYWAVAALLRAERKFKRVKGYREIPKLIAILNQENLDRKAVAA